MAAGFNTQQVRLSAAMATFFPDASQAFPFAASQWPACADELRGQVTEAVDVFIMLVKSPPNIFG
ncbi:MAG TPA: hypothetical protein VGF92_13975 [Stellaceae bacterium]|jgi:hypothetical protein